jgi:hypothetical protein
VDLGAAPRFDAQEGVAIEAWVRPDDFSVLRDPQATGPRRTPPPGAGPGDQYLFQVAGKGDAYFLQVREDYAVEAGVLGEGDKGRKARGQRETRPGTLVRGRWSHVAMVYDGLDLRILVDGQPRDLGPTAGEVLPRRLVASAAPLVVSHPDPRLTFLGAVDEVRVSAIVAEEEVLLPGDITVEGPAIVRFDSHGQLDPLHHDAPLTFRVARVRRDGNKVTVLEKADIAVELSGIVR